MALDQSLPGFALQTKALEKNYDAVSVLHKIDIAMVFQSYALYPAMTVAQNIGFGMKIRWVPKPQIATKIAEVAKLLQIGHLLDRQPGQPSGGSGSALPWAGRWCVTPSCFCATSHCRTLTPGCASKCGPRETTPKAAPPSHSPARYPVSGPQPQSYSSQSTLPA